jgi:hypothetical protein
MVVVKFKNLFKNEWKTKDSSSFAHIHTIQHKASIHVALTGKYKREGMHQLMHYARLGESNYNNDSSSVTENGREGEKRRERGDKGYIHR